MKRSTELLVGILELAETWDEDGCGNLNEITVDGHSRANVNYHLNLYVEAGLVNSSVTLPLMLGDDGWVGETSNDLKLTWLGHNALLLLAHSELIHNIVISDGRE